MERARQLPGWRRTFPFLLPCAVVFVLGAQVAAYFGIPTMLLNAMGVSLGLGYLWPRWRAREIAAFWTPAERYLGITVSRGGMQVRSAGAVREVAVGEILRVSALPEGWFFWFRDKPPLWVPRGAFGETQGEAIDGMLGPLTTDGSGSWLPWAIVVAGGVSVAGTALWYLSA